MNILSTLVFPNELPNSKRIHKVNILSTLVFPNELPNSKRIHKGNILSTLVFPNELPNSKRIHKGKNNEKKQPKNKREKNGKKTEKHGQKKTGKKSWRTLLPGGGINFSWELAYFIAGGLLTPCEHKYLIVVKNRSS